MITILFTICPVDTMHINIPFGAQPGWPLKPFLVKNRNLIKMLTSTINKLKKLTKYSKSEHQNYPKPNVIRVSHTKNIH